MIKEVFIPRWRIDVATSRSSGPGGQKVNKTKTKVEIRFKIAEADWIPDPIRRRFSDLFSNRITKDGEFVLTSEEHRSQVQNLEQCFKKLRVMLDQATPPPKVRIKTKATRGSQRRRIEGKRIQSSIKKQRGRIKGDD